MIFRSTLEALSIFVNVSLSDYLIYKTSLLRKLTFLLFRDFVNLRHWSLINGTFVSAACSVEHPAMPPQPKKVRYTLIDRQTTAWPVRLNRHLDRRTT